MRNFVVALLAASVLATGCKRNPEATAPIAQATPAPTPAPTPEPTPEPTPIDLNSQVIVFCYHRFEEKGGREMVSTPAEFEAQMQALKDNGITVISMDDFLAWRRGEKAIPSKSAIISLDDGWHSGYTTAWPILKKFGYPFTMFIYTDYVKGGAKAGGQSMTWEQLAEMRDAGVEIASHTVTHSALSARKGKSDEAYHEWLVNEIANSKKILEDKLGIRVRALAYPYGMHNEAVRKVVMDSGYDVAFTVYGQRVGHNADAAAIGRYAVDSKNAEIFEKAISFQGPVSGGDGAIMPASATMVTKPMDGETVTDPMPEISANLATFGDIDPKTVTVRVSGLGVVPAEYDAATKTVRYKFTQKVQTSPVTVIVGATAGNRKVEARWSFKVEAGES